MQLTDRAPIEDFFLLGGMENQRQREADEEPPNGSQEGTQLSRFIRLSHYNSK